MLTQQTYNNNHLSKHIRDTWDHISDTELAAQIRHYL